MAQFEPMRCFTCGEPLSSKYELFQAMREAYIAHKNPKSGIDVHANNKYVNPDVQENLEEVFEAMHLNKLCCRMRIANAVPAITLT
jgi:DNA-directed RNA polymerase subunit N (RpoN/RPB10)